METAMKTGSWWCVGIGAAALLGGCASPAPASPLAVSFRGTALLGSTATDQNGQSFTIAGLSGIMHLGEGRFAAVMDNSNRVVLLDVEVNDNGSIASAAIAGGLTLSQTRDHEGICPGTSCDGSFFISDETTGPPAIPAVHEYDRATGQLLRTLTPPEVFRQAVANFGFEALTRSPMGGVMWTANEEALAVDGPLSSPSNGTMVRLLRWTVRGQAVEPAGQHAYLTESMHAGPINGGRSGVVSMVALPDGRLLVLERSLAASFLSPFRCRIYLVEFDGATEASGFTDGLIGAELTTVGKTLLWSGNVTNMEGLSLGRRLPGGSWSLIGIVDNGDPISQNTLVAFELSGVGPAAEDIDGDGAVEAEDVYRWHMTPVDVTGDALIDAGRRDGGGRCRTVGRGVRGRGRASLSPPGRRGRPIESVLPERARGGAWIVLSSMPVADLVVGSAGRQKERA